MVVNNLIRRLGNAEYFYYQYNKIAPTNFAVAPPKDALLCSAISSYKKKRLITALIPV